MIANKSYAYIPPALPIVPHCRKMFSNDAWSLQKKLSLENVQFDFILKKEAYWCSQSEELFDDFPATNEVPIQGTVGVANNAQKWHNYNKIHCVFSAQGIFREGGQPFVGLFSLWRKNTRGLWCLVISISMPRYKLSNAEQANPLWVMLVAKAASVHHKQTAWAYRQSWCATVGGPTQKLWWFWLRGEAKLACPWIDIKWPGQGH